MQKINRELYSDITGADYKKSYGNPAYAAGQFGLEVGSLLSLLYAEVRAGIPGSFENRIDYLTILCELFIEIYNYFENCLEEGN